MQRRPENFRSEAAVLDGHLARRAYLVGNGPTLADFPAVSPLVYAAEGQLPIGDFPNLRDWSARILALPAWRDTAPMPRSGGGLNERSNQIALEIDMQPHAVVSREEWLVARKALLLLKRN